MKKIIFLITLLCASAAFAESSESVKPGAEWNPTILSDDTIKKLQSKQYEYRKCVSEQMLDAGYVNMSVQQSTETIMKKCEFVLAQMREVYIEVEVPEAVADRHLKQMRMQTTRLVLQEMMMRAAQKTVN